MAILRREMFSVTPRQLEVLSFLAHRERWSVGEVASALGVSSAAATKALLRLERKGLVTRYENILDRRCVDVTVTHAGKELLRTAVSGNGHR